MGYTHLSEENICNTPHSLSLLSQPIPQKNKKFSVFQHYQWALLVIFNRTSHPWDGLTSCITFFMEINNMQPHFTQQAALAGRLSYSSVAMEGYTPYCLAHQSVSQQNNTYMVQDNQNKISYLPWSVLKKPLQTVPCFALRNCLQAADS